MILGLAQNRENPEVICKILMKKGLGLPFKGGSVPLPPHGIVNSGFLDLLCAKVGKSSAKTANSGQQTAERAQAGGQRPEGDGEDRCDWLNRTVPLTLRCSDDPAGTNEARTSRLWEIQSEGISSKVQSA